MRKTESWADTWMKIAYAISERSKDESFRAGSVLVANDNKTVLGLGYNGAPPEMYDPHIDQTDRTLVRAVTNHSESNSLWYAVAAHGRDALIGSCLYVNGRPCHQCVKEAARAGCNHIVWDDTNPSQPKMADEEDWNKSVDIAQRASMFLTPYSQLKGR